MAYRGSTAFDHDTSRPRTGVLLVNLGTPAAPTRQALRPYLKQFLSDPRVVEAPRLLWWLILNLVILNTRPARSAANYRKVWTEQGSPLLVHTRAIAEALQQRLSDRFGEDMVVDFAMRYGDPSVDGRLQALADLDVRRLLVLPLYPQYAGPTTASTFDALGQSLAGRRWLPELRFISHYHDHPGYIAALVGSIRRHWDRHGRADRLLFSYHGAPRSYLDQGDPYYCECHKTTRLVVEALALAEDDYRMVFQSRFGRGEWLQPYTDETLRALPAEGVRSVQVICPGFAADCLETLEEIGEENREYFLQAGGERYEYIPCLNEQPDHIDALATLVENNLAGWSAPETP